MVITIVGSMQFHNEMQATREALQVMGHDVLVPKNFDVREKNEAYMETDKEKITAKIEYDFIRDHFRKIERSDAILVLNYDKHDIPNYVGGNTFLEMGVAFWLKKRIYLLHPIPDMQYRIEMHAMKPTILNGDLSHIQEEDVAPDTPVA